jgi:acetolactate synthase I/II/III large subunit
VQAADLVGAVGPRLDELTRAGYRLLEPPRPRQRLVHVHQSVEQLGSLYQADLAIAAGMPAFAAAARALPPVADPAWGDWSRAARGDCLAWSRPPPSRARLDPAAVVAWVSERLPADAVLTSGAGNDSGWVQRYYRFRQLGTQLTPKGGTMGYGLPAAIAAKLAHPERVVVAFAGDGCFLMTGQELATAVRHDVRVVVVVLDNGMYGTISMHQERDYPGRVVGTDLVNPDFAAMARAFGAHGEVVEETAGFPDAFERALAAGRPALLELRTDPDAITPSTTLHALRAQTQRRRPSP